MRVCAHITFFYQETRVSFLQKVVAGLQQWKEPTQLDIFIHTNACPEFRIPELPSSPHPQSSSKIICYSLGAEHPFYLSWKCRDLLRLQASSYDVFIYLEDDIYLPPAALSYWLAEVERVGDAGYTPGFLRIETNSEGAEFVTDLPGQKLQPRVDTGLKNFILHDQFPYCGFWIYRRREFEKWALTPYFNPATVDGYGIREASAIGMMGMTERQRAEWFRCAVLPIIQEGEEGEEGKEQNIKKITIDPCCRVYHLANNYVSGPSVFATIPFHHCVNNPITE